MSGLAAYRRADGRWGLRNHVLVLPLHAACCPAAQAIAASLPSVVTVSHDWTGVGDDRDVARAEATLVGHAAHPNVAASLMVALSPDDSRLAERARERGHRVEIVSLTEHGGTAGAIEAGIAAARTLLAHAATLRPVPATAAAISLGLECGGSDAMSGITANPALGVASDALVAAGGTSILAETSELIGAEQALARRATTPEVGAAIVEMIERFEREAAALAVDLLGGQPAPGNIAGGLTTIEEKAIGAAMKGGSAPISGVLRYAEAPPEPGLFVMDTPGNDIEQMVGMVAAGANLVAFTTGRGTPTGSPIAPCLKIATNTALYRRMSDDLDLDAGTILSAGESVARAGQRIYEALLATAAGALTVAERSGANEFAISRLYGT